MSLACVRACAWAITAFQEGHLCFSLCSCPALCAPAIPGAARGKQLGGDGQRVAQGTLSNPSLCLTESEGDTPNYPAEGPVYPHRRRWDSWVLKIKDRCKGVGGQWG